MGHHPDGLVGLRRLRDGAPAHAGTRAAPVLGLPARPIAGRNYAGVAQRTSEAQSLTRREDLGGHGDLLSVSARAAVCFSSKKFIMKIYRVNNLIPAIEGHDVGMNEWRKSKGSILTSVGGYTCVMAAVYLPEESTGYIGHFSALNVPKGLYNHETMSDRRIFEEMLEDIVAQRTTKIETFLGGSSFSGSASTTDIEIQADRAYAEERMRQICEDGNLTVAWQAPRTSTDILLDCRTGELLVQQTDVRSY